MTPAAGGPSAATPAAQSTHAVPAQAPVAAAGQGHGVLGGAAPVADEARVRGDRLVGVAPVLAQGELAGGGLEAQELDEALGEAELAVDIPAPGEGVFL